MKIAHADITLIISSLSQKLQALKSKIGEELSNVNEEELKKLLEQLHHDANQLAREVNQSQDIKAFDPKLKVNLISQIYSIQHSPAYSQALGGHESEASTIFRKIEAALSKSEKKVKG